MSDLYHVGVTGSRFGMTDEQADEMYGLLKTLSGFHRHNNGDRWALHHGDCTGTDAEAAEMGRDLGFWVVSHPPLSERYRAHAYADEVREPKGYHARDRDVVDESSELFAAPASLTRAGGTWYTIGYAESRKVPYHLLPSRWARDLGLLPVVAHS